MKWFHKKFNELSLNEFYEILKLRVAVFVVEQTCPYQEIDQYDKKATHIFCLNKQEEAIAVARILEHSTEDAFIRFGRVAVAKPLRGGDLSHQLMLHTLSYIEEDLPNKPIKISAQSYIKRFYERYGFKKVGTEYVEDGIPHIDMIKE